MADHESRNPQPGGLLPVPVRTRGERDHSAGSGRGRCRRITTCAGIAGRGSACTMSCCRRKRGRMASRRIRSCRCVQVGKSGNTPVFRCPYHAWTYDLSGALVSYPPGDAAGLRPGAARAAPGARPDGRGIHLRELRAGRAARVRPVRRHVARDRPAVWDGAIEGGGAPVAADEGELEAGAGELPGVLSLFTVA